MLVSSGSLTRSLYRHPYAHSLMDALILMKLPFNTSVSSRSSQEGLSYHRGPLVNSVSADNTVTSAVFYGVRFLLGGSLYF